MVQLSPGPDAQLFLDSDFARVYICAARTASDIHNQHFVTFFISFPLHQLSPTAAIQFYCLYDYNFLCISRYLLLFTSQCIFFHCCTTNRSLNNHIFVTLPHVKAIHGSLTTSEGNLLANWSVRHPDQNSVLASAYLDHFCFQLFLIELCMKHTLRQRYLHAGILVVNVFKINSCGELKKQDWTEEKVSC